MTALKPLDRPMAASAAQPGWQALPSRDFVEIEVSGGKLNIATIGAGPPLFLLHGWTLDHRVWAPQWFQLSQHFRLVMPDRRGFGASTARPDLAAESDDICAIADVLGIDRFGIVGMSQAGVIALDCALRYPERISAVATLGAPLAGTVPGGDPMDRDRWAGMIASGDVAHMQAEWLAHPLMQTINGDYQTLLESIVADYDGRDLLAPSVLPTIGADDLAAIGVPVLAMAGTSDSPWRQSVARFIGDKTPAGSYCSIPQGGHLANVCQPETFDARLTGFFRHFCN